MTSDERDGLMLDRLSVAVLLVGLVATVAVIVHGVMVERRWTTELSVLLSFALLFAAALVDEMLSTWQCSRRAP